MSYFNTTAQAGELLRQHKACAKGQDLLVLSAFLSAGSPLGPSEVHQALARTGAISSHVPITSIRRSVTTLTQRGLLEKTAAMRDGLYGREEHCWRFRQGDRCSDRAGGRSVGTVAGVASRCRPTRHG